MEILQKLYTSSLKEQKKLCQDLTAIIKNQGKRRNLPYRLFNFPSNNFFFVILELSEPVILAICKELEKVLVTYNRKSQVFITNVIEAVIKTHPKWTTPHFVKVIVEFSAARKKRVATLVLVMKIISILYFILFDYLFFIGIIPCKMTYVAYNGAKYY